MSVRQVTHSHRSTYRKTDDLLLIFDVIMLLLFIICWIMHTQERRRRLAPEHLLIEEVSVKMKCQYQLIKVRCSIVCSLNLNVQGSKASSCEHKGFYLFSHSLSLLHKCDKSVLYVGGLQTSVNSDMKTRQCGCFKSSVVCLEWKLYRLQQWPICDICQSVSVNITCRKLTFMLRQSYNNWFS